MKVVTSHEALYISASYFHNCYGYNRDKDKNLVINEQETPLVIRIFARTKERLKGK